MNLVAYSDSEGSDNDAPAPPRPKPVAKASLSSKPAFQKVVDRANPNKIRLNLPAPSHPTQPKDDIDADAPPAKKARTSGGAFSAFNSMLPAPKKAAAPAGSASESAPAAKRLGKGLGSGVNLRTGAAPGFSREPVEVPDYGAEEEDGSTASAAATIAPGLARAEPKPQEPELKLVGKPMRFRPLSVANKKKKRVLPAGVSSAALKKAPTVTPTTASPATPTTTQKPAPKPKVSLFSMAPVDTPELAEPSSKGEYTPLLHVPSPADESKLPDSAFSEPAPSTNTPQTLSSIATDLNLSPHELRQLLGRNASKNSDLSALNITNFNTDAEYAHNEQLRQAGETVQHHALKSIAGTGKNSLKSLVNTASTQKDALEEHFAAGRRNKKEAGGKYGW
ncbi:uncharacterized protein BDZ99DRAFT_444617 [Mytilinidion resinicola]|uniref:Uncharacterized protein n=1 Tax=Mytilinidion resinicola TaxID=574789 RepID=A0A6A6YLF8_9PEZI|nr:uncharacterized protein BDZ99DRAFT_444617 [Mytilinidion resinicola]KAF2808814.1 hypothetical protein BDZ99DRAFT_444617 [Mytilinidion resinicola]